MRTLIKHVLAATAPVDRVLVKGWVRTRRDSKGFSFIELNDGSCLASLQVVVDASVPGADPLQRFTTGASAVVEGQLLPSPAQGQKWELRATRIELLGAADASYPLQKKGHTAEFLRTIAHLRPRSNLYGAMFRIRSRLAFAVHQFFQERDFVYIHTPIITASDCEGAGELFRVTTLKGQPGEKPEQDFFGKPTFLTVSGQLEAEAFACALSNVYTFGPTFRAENSNTARHAAEFWMIEPEMAFCDLQADMDLGEEFIKAMARYALEQCAEDLAVFERFVDKGVRERLTFVVERPFVRVPYAEAIEILKKSGRRFEFPIEHGLNLQSEHERFLTEEHFKSPTTVFNYPREIKPFYMRLNDDGGTVAAMDVLVPGIGEVIGGAQREERLEALLENMKQHHLKPEDYWWYLDLRRFGTVPHAGFGVGFERLLMFLTGMPNIRDVIPFARTPGHAEF
ncbi:MAG TPA: asparagine--tRNA ligase [Verrucomicrobia bacterium]|nr:asparagine--tRNA ligase [Verrucomicrobiota bacterium]HOB32112.1 asparagine--tRNA ligase [Verrucomicrobiota bacterium]HOP98267.1 asparagine--tRNA ligase [Verrucomicrobiota bacterium]HPU55651.1 asparagine--tRNA ligase [Verrucomicrobiota bacterium]